MLIVLLLFPCYAADITGCYNKVDIGKTSKEVTLLSTSDIKVALTALLLK